VRRFFCGNASCKAVTFAEQFQGLTPPRSRRTPPLARMLTAIGLAMAAASHADSRTTMRYDQARGSLDRHATYIVAAYIAGAAR